jgi:Tfp pilus assembly protein PilV
MNKKGFTPTPIIRQKMSKNKLVWGFTLMEVLISALIMSLVMTGLVNIFLAGKRHILHSRSKIQAAELGRLFLAPLQMDVRKDLWSGNCLGSSSGCPSTPANNISIDGITYKPSTTVNQNYAGTTLSKVKLTITWDEISP